MQQQSRFQKAETLPLSFRYTTQSLVSHTCTLQISNYNPSPARSLHFISFLKTVSLQKKRNLTPVSSQTDLKALPTNINASRLQR
jgi:hypothetical protein